MRLVLFALLLIALPAAAHVRLLGTGTHPAPVSAGTTCVIDSGVIGTCTIGS